MFWEYHLVSLAWSTAALTFILWGPGRGRAHSTAASITVMHISPAVGFKYSLNLY